MKPSFNEILAQGSDSFRRVNAAAAGKIPLGTRAESRKGRHLAPALPHPESQSDERITLEQASAIEGGGAAASQQRPRVAITLFRVKKLDRDNKWASVKFLLDAICAAGLIPDDRECDIDLSVTQTAVPKYTMEGTGIVIAYRNEK